MYNISLSIIVVVVIVIIIIIIQMNMKYSELPNSYSHFHVSVSLPSGHSVNISTAWGTISHQFNITQLETGKLWNILSNKHRDEDLHDMETLPALLALCEGNPPMTGGFPSQRASIVEL